MLKEILFHKLRKIECSYLILKIVVLSPLEKKSQVIESMGQILLSGSLLCVILWIYLSVQNENFALQQSNLSQTVAIDNDGNLCVFAGSDNVPIL